MDRRPTGLGQTGRMCLQGSQRRTAPRDGDQPWTPALEQRRTQRTPPDGGRTQARGPAAA